MRTRRILPLLLGALLLGAGACDSPSDPGGREVPAGELTFIRQAQNAPPLQNGGVVSAWVKKGDSETIELRYTNGHDCLELRLHGDALDRRPDGTRIAEGDSVLITIRITDAALYDFEFQPAGLRFDPARQPELRISYRYANRDFNGDGVIDDRDRDVDFGFWHLETGDTGWDEIGTVTDFDLEELRADIRGFSRYAIASE